MRRAITLITAAAGWTVASATPGSAQRVDSSAVPLPSGAFLGVIRSATDSTPVRTADVRLYFVDSTRVVRDPLGGTSTEAFVDTVRSRLRVSDSTGFFAIWHVAAGRYLLNVRRIGFAPLEAMVTVDTGTLSHNFTMMPTSSILAKVEITDSATNYASLRLDHAGFIRRSHGGMGQFIKREEFMEHQPETLGDILSRYGLRAGADYRLDRMALGYDDISDYPADLIAGIELYRHNRPIEFNGTRGGANLMSAGGMGNLMRPLVLIWTYFP